MHKLSLLGILAVMLLTLSCNGSDPQPVIVADIFSDQATDGDIAFDPVLQSFTITNGPETLFFGIDDSDQNFPEYRAFLDFPLDGSTGGEVPLMSQSLDFLLRIWELLCRLTLRR